MTKTIRDTTIAALGVLMLGMTTTSVADGSSAAQDDFEATYEAAQAARAEAAAAGFEWRDTAEFLEESQELAAAGDYDAAIKLAERAKKESELALAQAQTEAENWKERVIK